MGNLNDIQTMYFSISAARRLLSSVPMQKPKKVTHATIRRFIDTILPPKANDVTRLYHVPRNPRYDPQTAIADQIILSVAPTPSVYSFIGQSGFGVETESNAPKFPPGKHPPRTLCFLHRPFKLDRRRVRGGTLILSSHTSFDEILTVGWNVVLAKQLGMNVDESFCIQGYKGDVNRKIGIVGQASVPRDTLIKYVQEEFRTTELIHKGLSSEIRIIAIMNAFHEDEVRRVLEIAQQRGWIESNVITPGQQILYLTGEPRIGGLQAAQALGMTVVCVGHREAEDWGIRYMAAQLRAAFPAVPVQEVYEEEEVPGPKVRGSEVLNDNT